MPIDKCELTFSCAVPFPDSQLAGEWQQVFYDMISRSLGYSRSKDEEGRDLLKSIIRKKGSLSLDLVGLARKVRNRTVFVCGAGPSISEDLMGLYGLLRNSSSLSIAADGAARALAQAMVIPAIITSDLDSCPEDLLLAQSEERALFVHAHGDNIDLVRHIAPRLGRRILGTTQVDSVDGVTNVGGFTDGDRACYIAASFEPRTVVLIGMDFGSKEGKFSLPISIRGKRTDKKTREVKLKLGKESLEFLIDRRPSVRFVNATSGGEQIKGAQRISHAELIEELS